MKRLSDQTLYELLEVREDAGTPDIEKAYQRARDIYGPGSLATYTLMTPDEAALLARRLEEARATLLDPAARARYDDALRRPREAVASAGVASAAGAPFAPLPPVIPAATPPPRAPAALPPPEEEEAGDPVAASAPDEPAPAEPSPAEPSTVEPSTVEPSTVEPPPPEATPAPAAPPRPILLQREVRRPPEPYEGERFPSAAKHAVPEPAAPAPRERPLPTPPPLPPAASPPPVHVAVPVVPDGAWTGDALRQMREARGLTVLQIAERTKVTRHHIENIEAERFSALPAPVYLRGILLSLARELRLDGQKVARAFLERAAAALGKAK